MNPTDVVLQPDTVRLLAELPKGVRLTRLAVKYPRIANRIAKDWMRPDLMRPYLRSLLIDERGGRQGFPPNIVAELLRISRYYDNQVFPTDEPVTAGPEWDDRH